jgi:hypothetical protein
MQTSPHTLAAREREFNTIVHDLSSQIKLRKQRTQHLEEKIHLLENQKPDTDQELLSQIQFLEGELDKTEAHLTNQYSKDLQKYIIELYTVKDELLYKEKLLLEMERNSELDQIALGQKIQTKINIQMNKFERECSAKLDTNNKKMDKMNANLMALSILLRQKQK